MLESHTKLAQVGMYVLVRNCTNIELGDREGSKLFL